MKRILFLGAAMLAFASCRREPLNPPVQGEGFLLDTLVRFTVHEAVVGPDSVRSAIRLCVDELRRLEGVTDAHVDTSDIARINRSAGRQPVEVRPETIRLLRESLEISSSTEGGFDFTLGNLKRLWGFDSESPRVPPADSIRLFVRAAGPRRLVLDGRTAFLPDRNARIDLGGLGEGFLLDAGVKFLTRAGIRSGIIEATGDLVAFGRNPKRPFWRIGVKDPRDPSGGLIGAIELPGASVATSGDYERYFMENGRRYCHLLDPKTGYPAAAGCISVTVVAPNALLADAYATGLFALTPDKALAVIENTPGLDGIVMTEENGRVVQRVSKGLIPHYRSPLKR
jgi:FAD:protein FMN transferase